MTDAEKVQMLREALETCCFDYDDEEEGYYWFDEELVEKALTAIAPIQPDSERDAQKDVKQSESPQERQCTQHHRACGEFPPSWCEACPKLSAFSKWWNMRGQYVNFPTTVERFKELCLIAYSAAQRHEGTERAWRESLVERCVRAGISYFDDPESTLTELIKWEVQIATDPKVNGQGQDTKRLAFVLKHGWPSRVVGQPGIFWRYTWSDRPFGPLFVSPLEAIDAGIVEEEK